MTTRISKTTKAKLDTLYNAGVKHGKLKTNEGIGVQGGGRAIVLLNTHGKKTPAGLYWEGKSGEALPEGGYLQQTPARDGNQETIKLRNGKRAVTRRWDTGPGDFKFTALGKSFYSTFAGITLRWCL